MAQRVEEPRRRYKLRVNFVGANAYDKDENILPYRKLIYLAYSDERVGDVRRKIESMFASMNPEDGQRQVARLRDSYMCDVSDEFLVSDVFDESPIVYAAMNGLDVLDDDSLVSASPTGTGYADSSIISLQQGVGGFKRKRYVLTPQHIAHVQDGNGSFVMTPRILASGYSTDDQGGHPAPRKMRRMDNNASIYTVKGPESVSPELTPHILRKDISLVGGDVSMLPAMQTPVTNSSDLRTQLTAPSSPEIRGNRSVSPLMPPLQRPSHPETSSVATQGPVENGDMQNKVLTEDSQQTQLSANSASTPPARTANDAVSLQEIPAQATHVAGVNTDIAPVPKNPPSSAAPVANAQPRYALRAIKRKGSDEQQTSVHSDRAP
ncbi:hypothetical protein LPJ59_005578, partial [Coemansia sp. RSA 2399]